MARILSVVWYKVLPARFGGQKGIAQFNEHLCRHHELHCLCAVSNDPQDVPYAVYPELPEGRSQVADPRNWMRILRRIRGLQVTHLLLEHCYYAIPALLAKRFLSTRLILHAHNIESDRFRTLGKPWWPLLWLLERQVCRAADLVLFKTSEDLGHACREFGMDPQKALVVPFGLERSASPGADERRIAREMIRNRHGIREDERILLFTGTLDYAPNAEALEVLVARIIPMLQADCDLPFRVIACGRIHHPGYAFLRGLSHEKYIYAGEVEDLAPYLMSADLFLNPVCTGGGIKVKTLEALSYNLTVVSTEQGARGIDRDLAGEKLLTVADRDWSAFCRSIRTALGNASDIPAAFHVRYAWHSIVASVARRIETL